MKNFSIFESNFERYPMLCQDISCQVLVIGGGIAGLLTAYMLNKRGNNVVLVEAGSIAKGITNDTTAAITCQHGVIYNDIAKRYSFDFAKRFYNSQIDGIKAYEDLIQQGKIACDFTKLNGYIFTTDDTTAMRKELEILQKFGGEPTFLTSFDSINFKINGAIMQKNQAQFDPLKFLSGLDLKFDIYENTRIIDIDFKTKTAESSLGKIKAEKIVVATHFPIVNIPAFTFIKQYQSTTYAAAYSGAGQVNGIYAQDRDDGITLRNYKDLLIVGGFDHRTGRRHQENHFANLDKTAKLLYPNCSVASEWLGEDCVTFDHLPLVGRIKSKDDSSYIITGFNKWGMANSIISAQLIADLINNVPNANQEVFSPSRGYIRHNLGGFSLNFLNTCGNLIKSFVGIPLKSVKNMPKFSGGIYLYNGKKCAVYKDENGKIFAIGARCPHLKCELVFNAEAKTWDCPCHGSRLDIHGNIITEPTVKKAVRK